MTTSLKAVKKATKAPSKVEYILQDAVKKAIHEQVTPHFVQANTYKLKQAELFNLIADNIGRILEPAGEGVKPIRCTYAHWMAVMAYAKQDMINSRNILASSADVYMVEVVEILRAKGIEKPEQDTPSAKSMSKSRAIAKAEQEKLASIPTVTLQKSLSELASNGDTKQVAIVARELDKRKKEAVKAQKADTKDLRDGLTKWVREMNPESLAALMWVRDNWNDLKGQYNKVK